MNTPVTPEDHARYNKMPDSRLKAGDIVAVRIGDLYYVCMVKKHGDRLWVTVDNIRFYDVYDDIEHLILLSKKER